MSNGEKNALSESDPQEVQAWLFHEDNLATSRSGQYLVAHGLLLTAATLSNKGGNAANTLGVFAAFGIVLGLIWLIEALRARQNISAAVDVLKKSKDPTFQELSPKFWAGIVGKVPRVVLLLSLPIVAIIGWVLLWLQ